MQEPFSKAFLIFTASACEDVMSSSSPSKLCDVDREVLFKFLVMNFEKLCVDS